MGAARGTCGTSQLLGDGGGRPTRQGCHSWDPCLWRPSVSLTDAARSDGRRLLLGRGSRVPPSRGQQGCIAPMGFIGSAEQPTKPWLESDGLSREASLGISSALSPDVLFAVMCQTASLFPSPPPPPPPSPSLAPSLAGSVQARPRQDELWRRADPAGVPPVRPGHPPSFHLRRHSPQHGHAGTGSALPALAPAAAVCGVSPGVCSTCWGWG